MHLLNRLNLRLAGSKFANVRMPKEVVLDEYVPQSAVVYSVILDNLLHSFLVNQMVKNDGYAFVGINLCGLDAPFGAIAKFLKSILSLVSSIFDPITTRGTFATLGFLYLFGL